MKITKYNYTCENDYCNHTWKEDSVLGKAQDECWMCGCQFIKVKTSISFIKDIPKENVSPHKSTQKQKKKKKKRSNKRGKRNENSNNNSV